MESLNVEKIVLQQCDAVGVGVIKSTIDYIAGMGYFTWELLGNQMMIEHYSSTLIYTKFFGNKDQEELPGSSDVSEREKISDGRRAHL